MPRPLAGMLARILAAVLLLALSTAAVRPAAAAAPAPRRASFDGIPADRLQQVIDRAYDLEDDAPAQIDALRRDFPESLVPDVIRVTRLYWMQSYVQVDAELTRTFEREAEDLLERAQRRLRAHPDDPDLLVINALSHLTLGGFYAEYERWWPAFWRVRSGRSLALRALKHDPTHPEAMMPLGALECYLAQTPGYLKPLARMLGTTGSLEAGLRHLRTASEEAVLAGNEATFYLYMVHAELRHDPAAARAPMEHLATLYPENPFFQRLLAISEIRSGARDAGRARLRRIPEMRRAREMPTLAVRALMRLCWDTLETHQPDEALEASTRAGTIVAAAPELRGLRAQPLLGQAEALAALGRPAEALAQLEAVPTEDAAARKRAQARMRELKQQMRAEE